ncbi:MAG: hypothetical protein RSP_12900 [Rhodanobacter sp.]
MSRSVLRHLRRCRVLFALALCAWLGLAATVFAQADGCAGMRGMATAHNHDMPAQAGGGHADCACAHVAATVPATVASMHAVHFPAAAWQALPAVAPEVTYAPPLRPPLA